MTPNEYLDLIDKDEKLSEYKLRCIRDYEVLLERGESRRWVRSNISLIKLCNRYFILYWDEGLTERQEDGYWEQPIEVINPEITYKSVPITRVFSKDGICYELDGISSA